MVQDFECVIVKLLFGDDDDDDVGGGGGSSSGNGRNRYVNKCVFDMLEIFFYLLYLCVLLFFVFQKLVVLIFVFMIYGELS